MTILCVEFLIVLLFVCLIIYGAKIMKQLQPMRMVSAPVEKKKQLRRQEIIQI